MSMALQLNHPPLPAAEMLNVINSCIATKFTHRFGTLMAVGGHECLEASDPVPLAFDCYMDKRSMLLFV